VLALVLSGSAGAGTAALPPLYVNPAGADGGRCARAQPCRSFDRAYRVARPGQVVFVAGGTYPDQTIERDASKRSGRDVIFRPSPGARVVIDDTLKINGSHVSFQGMKVREWEVWGPADDVTLRNIDVDAFWITSASNVRIIGGDVGPYENGSSQIRSAYRSQVQSRNILVDGVHFHDYDRTDPDSHMECLQVWGTRGLTIRRSKFRRCAIFDVFIANDGDAAGVSDVVVENSFFDEATAGGYYALFFDSKGRAMSNILVRNNSLLQGVYVETGSGPISNVRIIGNVGPRNPNHCYEGVVFRHNVWHNARCGATDRRAPAGFRNPATFDLRLNPCSAAVDFGDRQSYPRDDIEGQGRPRGRGPDAGADEVSQRCRRR
jgi:hypothetical protein